MNKPLPYKKIEFRHPYQERVMFFDPSEVFDRVKIDHYRRNPSVSINDIFPQIPGLCSCGCGKELSGRRRRWAADECMHFAEYVRLIIYGELSSLQKFLRLYHGWKCSMCGVHDIGHDMGANGCISFIKVDHIIPVKHGGGGWWLSNYQLLCHDCHVKKTNEDFGWKGQNKAQSKLFSDVQP